jgi:hypothetical protein
MIKHDKHWTTWAPETPEDVDVGAENLNGQMACGSLVSEFHAKMACLYVLRCDIKMGFRHFDIRPPETFQQILDRVNV